MKKISNSIDGEILAETANANDTVDDGDLGGTAGLGFTLTTSNISRVFSIVKRKLKRQNIDMDNLFATISGEFEEVLINYLDGKESALGDSSGLNGAIGRYYGFDLFSTNALYWTGVLSMATDWTATDTIVINGVTFLAKAAPSVAGDVDVTGTADATRVLLAAFINAPGTSSSGEYVALSAADQKLMKGITATDSPGDDTLTITAKGWGYVEVAETFTDTTDAWTTAKEIQHQLFGRKGAIDVVIQAKPNVKVKDVPDKLGVNILVNTLFGKKTYTDGSKEIIDVQIRSEAF